MGELINSDLDPPKRVKQPFRPRLRIRTDGRHSSRPIENKKKKKRGPNSGSLCHEESRRRPHARLCWSSTGRTSKILIRISSRSLSPPESGSPPTPDGSPWCDADAKRVKLSRERKNKRGEKEAGHILCNANLSRRRI